MIDKSEHIRTNSKECEFFPIFCCVRRSILREAIEKMSDIRCWDIANGWKVQQFLSGFQIQQHDRKTSYVNLSQKKRCRKRSKELTEIDPSIPLVYFRCRELSHRIRRVHPWREMESGRVPESESIGRTSAANAARTQRVQTESKRRLVETFRVEQCHKPAMTGNALYHLWWFGGWFIIIVFTCLNIRIRYVQKGTNHGSVELRDVFLSVFLGFFLPEIYQFNRKNMARYFLMNADHRTLMDSQHDSAIKK